MDLASLFQKKKFPEFSETSLTNIDRTLKSAQVQAMQCHSLFAKISEQIYMEPFSPSLSNTKQFHPRAAMHQSHLPPS